MEFVKYNYSKMLSDDFFDNVESFFNARTKHKARVQSKPGVLLNSRYHYGVNNDLNIDSVTGKLELEYYMDFRPRP